MIKNNAPSLSFCSRLGGLLSRTFKLQGTKSFVYSTKLPPQLPCLCIKHLFPINPGHLNLMQNALNALWARHFVALKGIFLKEVVKG